MQRRPTKAFWRAYGALYGDQVELPLASTKKRAPRKVNETLTEQEEQFRFVKWLRDKDIPHHHSPNGGYRNPIEAAKFKRLGTSPGFPDIFIPLARKGRHGLCIELKRVSGGTLSEHQQHWGELLTKQGYAWYEAKGAQEAIKITEDYLQCS